MSREYQGRSEKQIAGNEKIMGFALLGLVITVCIMLIDKYLL